jgi:hypothetical protein
MGPTAIATTPEARLKAGREKSLRRRHPWVFSGGIDRIDGKPSTGATVRVLSETGEFLAHAAYSPESQIRLRVWTFNEAATVNAGLIARRIEQAIAARRAAGLLEDGGACRCSSLSKSVKASAVAPAKPARISPFSPMRRTLRAFPFITVWPIDTWPSPMTTSFAPFFTARMVVECQVGSSDMHVLS